MMSRPSQDRPELVELIKRSVERFNAMSPEDRATELRAQRISWVYGNLALAGSSVTKEQVAKRIDELYGRGEHARPEPATREGGTDVV